MNEWMVYRRKHDLSLLVVICFSVSKAGVYNLGDQLGDSLLAVLVLAYLQLEQRSDKSY